MTSLRKIGLAVSAIVFCLSLSAINTMAQTSRSRWEGRSWDRNNNNRWNRRDNRDEHRINRGYSSGQLSAGEYWRLQRRGNNLERLDNYYRRDGNLSYGERRSLNRRYNQYNRQIYRARRY